MFKQVSHTMEAPSPSISIFEHDDRTLRPAGRPDDDSSTTVVPPMLRLRLRIPIMDYICPWPVLPSCLTATLPTSYFGPSVVQPPKYRGRTLSRDLGSSQSPSPASSASLQIPTSIRGSMPRAGCIRVGFWLLITGHATALIQICINRPFGID